MPKFFIVFLRIKSFQYLFNDKCFYILIISNKIFNRNNFYSFNMTLDIVKICKKKNMLYSGF